MGCGLQDRPERAQVLARPDPRTSIDLDGKRGTREGHDPTRGNCAGFNRRWSLERSGPFHPQQPPRHKGRRTRSTRKQRRGSGRQKEKNFNACENPAETPGEIEDKVAKEVRRKAKGGKQSDAICLSWNNGNSPCGSLPAGVHEHGEGAHLCSSCNSPDIRRTSARPRNEGEGWTTRTRRRGTKWSDDGGDQKGEDNDKDKGSSEETASVPGSSGFYITSQDLAIPRVELKSIVTGLQRRGASMWKWSR